MLSLLSPPPLQPSALPIFGSAQVLTQFIAFDNERIGNTADMCWGGVVVVVVGLVVVMVVVCAGGCGWDMDLLNALRQVAESPVAEFLQVSNSRAQVLPHTAVARFARLRSTASSETRP